MTESIIPATPTMPRIGDPAPAFTASNLSGARHGFFGREGGVSTGIYERLNVGIGSSDDPALINENRNRAASFVSSGSNA